MVDKNVVVAVVCVDWRMHYPKSNFMERLYEHLGCDKIYIVSYPGPDALCSNKIRTARKSLEEIVNRTRAVLAEHHISATRKVLVAHSECAGHAVYDTQHRKDVKNATEIMNAELHPNVPVEALFAKKGKMILIGLLRCASRWLGRIMYKGTKECPY